MGMKEKNSPTTFEKYKESLRVLQSEDTTTSYIRIGINYFKVIEHINYSGKHYKELIYWNEAIFKNDFSKTALSQIQKFNIKRAIPDHINYEPFYGSCYNTYQKLSYLSIEGIFPNTLKFLKHIFGAQLELGFDYLKLIYLEPLQFLPILSLVSNERETGKSTFLKWLKEIYGFNMNFLDNHSLSSNFNNDWSGKILLALDEPSTIRKDIVEKF